MSGKTPGQESSGGYLDFDAIAQHGPSSASVFSGGYGPTFGNVSVGNPVSAVNWLVVGTVVVAVAWLVWGKR